MIAAWMLWSIGAGLLFLVAGLAVERLLEGKRRWVWAVAGLGTALLPAMRLLVGEQCCSIRSCVNSSQSCRPWWLLQSIEKTVDVAEAADNLVQFQ